MNLTQKISVLDKGYVKYIGHMGDDELIVESARMSTGKGFFGWFWEEDTFADIICTNCQTQHLGSTLPLVDLSQADGELLCTNCWTPGVRRLLVEDVPKLLGKKGQPRDFSLLETLYSQRHSTPFESGELMVEVYAPILVYREWFRSRTQSYNEFSARYAQMPNDHYVPTLERIQRQSKLNKQGSGEAFPEEFAADYLESLREEQALIYQRYDTAVRDGVAKEVARLNTPVSRYSKMRAKTDLRNWLWFLGLRMEKGAQWEIRMYANVVGGIIKEIWPKTFDLFIEHDFLSVRFSRTEMDALRKLIGAISRGFSTEEMRQVTGFGEKKAQGFIDKIFRPKETDYTDVLAKLGY